MYDNSQCRLCAGLKLKNDLVEIKNPDAFNLNLEYKIYYCFQIQLIENDPLPMCICSNCCQKVNATYEFTEQVHRVQEALRTANNPPAENKNPLKMELNDHIDFDDDDEDDDDEDDDNEPNLAELTECVLTETKQEIIFKSESQFSPKEEEKPLSRSQTKPKRSTRNSAHSNPDDIKRREERSALLIKIFREWKNYKWKCNDCSLVHTTVKDLRQHYTDVHQKPPVYTCLECSKVLDKYDAFQKHVRNHRNQHKFCCEVCGKFSYNKEHHERHKETHSKERKYMCSICGNHFKTTGSLRIHERLHLPPELRSRYECDICHKKLASQPSLWSHKKLHTGVKEHTCDICGKIFAQKTNLKQHVSLHEEGMPFLCALCPRTFKTARRLKRHEIVHTNLKPHKCDICGKQFRAKQTLNDHKTIHTDHFPYECEHCKKGFKLKQLLKVHLRQHTGERPYACIDCNHRFANWSNYNKHMKSRHGINMKHPVTQLIHEQQQQMMK